MRKVAFFLSDCHLGQPMGEELGVKGGNRSIPPSPAGFPFSASDGETSATWEAAEGVRFGESPSGRASGCE